MTLPMSGFTCPKCGAQTKVNETRTFDESGLRRRRCCTNYSCGFRFTTAEIAVGQSWLDGARTRGPVIAVRYRDLRAIAKLINEAIREYPEDLADTQGG